MSVRITAVACRPHLRNIKHQSKYLLCDIVHYFSCQSEQSYSTQSQNKAVSMCLQITECLLYSMTQYSRATKLKSCTPNKLSCEGRTTALSLYKRQHESAVLTAFTSSLSALTSRYAGCRGGAAEVRRGARAGSHSRHRCSEQTQALPTKHWARPLSRIPETPRIARNLFVPSAPFCERGKLSGRSPASCATGGNSSDTANYWWKYYVDTPALRGR